MKIVSRTLLFLKKRANDSLFTKEKRDENVQFNMDARALLLSLKENWGALGYFLEKNVACLSNALWNLFLPFKNPESYRLLHKIPPRQKLKIQLNPKKRPRPRLIPFRTFLQKIFSFHLLLEVRM